MATWPGRYVHIDAPTSELQNALEWLEEHNPAKEDCFILRGDYNKETRRYEGFQYYDDRPGVIRRELKGELQRREAERIPTEEAIEILRSNVVTRGILGL